MIQWYIETPDGDEIEVEIRVDSFTPGDPGRYYGPWEDSWPAEPAEIEWSVWDADNRERPDLDALLSDTTRDRIYDALLEAESEASYE